MGAGLSRARAEGGRQTWGADGYGCGVLPRIMIEDVRPRTPTGFPAKAAVGQTLEISADIFKDGHDVLSARVLIDGAAQPMALVTNDRWAATVTPSRVGAATFVVEAWVDRWATWTHNAEVKRAAGQDIALDREEGARLCEARLPAVAAALRSGDVSAALTDDTAAVMAGPLAGQDVSRSAEYALWVDRERAAVGAWYELFPRSHGGLARTADERLPAVAAMGFDVVYLPPIHPIGTSFRKGRDNSLTPAVGDPGSPWAIGSAEGGHCAVHPDLGTLDDLDHLVARAGELGLEVALDFALQCSPDHPWVGEHPEWFHHRPDGSIAYAENPPKKYQDIYPLDFWPAGDADRVALWEACASVVRFWADRGVRIFRVDNPHTKPVAFWAWLINTLRTGGYEDLIYLAEAFTTPKMMAKLGEIGFSQSYTYFTWRLTGLELTEYVEEVALGVKADWMRPAFWPNTPDILSGPLRDGPLSAFALRLVLAAFLAPTYGIYSGFELGENEPFSPANEEYRNSEKYEIKERNFSVTPSLVSMLTNVNGIRRRHASCARLDGVLFHPSDNEQLLVWSRSDAGGGDVLLVVVNLDPAKPQEGTLDIDLWSLGFGWDEPFDVHDELSGETFRWQGRHPWVRLDPSTTTPLIGAPQVAHVFRLRHLLDRADRGSA